MTNTGFDWNFDGYKQPAHFFIGGAFESFEFIQDFVQNTKNFPCLLKDNVVIDSVFGSPTCIWNGGRAIANIYYNKGQLTHIHDTYAKLGVKVRFIFTNSQLNEHDVYDRYGNLLMAMFHDLSPEVVVNSPLLEEYLRSHYPNVSFISSTTKRLRDSESQLKEFCHNYKYVCLDYDYNYDFDFLNSISENDRNRVEILVNSSCPKGCKVRVLHQGYSDKRQLEFNNDDTCEDTEPFYKECPFVKSSMSIPMEKKGYTREYFNTTNFIVPSELDRYLDMGFNHFKLQGRELFPQQIYAEIFPYLIRPQFYSLALSMIKI